MLRICEVNNPLDYYLTEDSDIIFKLEQKGIRPHCRDYDGCFYFKKSNKLQKALSDLNIEVTF